MSAPQRVPLKTAEKSPRVKRELDGMQRNAAKCEGIPRTSKKFEEIQKTSKGIHTKELQRGRIRIIELESTRERRLLAGL
jgi:hypothetical protein